MNAVVGNYIAILKEKGRYKVAKIVAVTDKDLSYQFIRTIPLDNTVYITTEPRVLFLRLANMSVKLLLGTEVLVMTNGFWRKGILTDRFPDSGLYEIKYRNGKVMTAHAKDVYHVLR